MNVSFLQLPRYHEAIVVHEEKKVRKDNTVGSCYKKFNE